MGILGKVRLHVARKQTAKRQKAGWHYKMWYYTKAEAEKVAAALRRDGKKTMVKRGVNHNYPHGGGRWVYDVWWKKP